MRKHPNYWNDERVAAELVPICSGTGMFPSNSDLSKLGRADLANQICRRGGFIAWANKLGFKRKDSDSDKGWDGEKKAVELLASLGFSAEKTNQIRAPYDILVNGCVRVDVKSATYAEYGRCKGWFYRIGKHTPADVLMLFQLDTGAAYYLPWTVCPTTNVTISRDGGIYVGFKNNHGVVHDMILLRQEEAKCFAAIANT